MYITELLTVIKPFDAYYLTVSLTKSLLFVYFSWHFSTFASFHIRFINSILHNIRKWHFFEYTYICIYIYIYFLVHTKQLRFFFFFLIFYSLVFFFFLFLSQQKQISVKKIAGNFTEWVHKTMQVHMYMCVLFTLYLHKELQKLMTEEKQRKNQSINHMVLKNHAVATFI